MQELDDNALLREYVERDSEEAFATLVTRHINKVYSVALRHTRNSHQAEEITQAVFVILAKKSHYLGKGVVLSGWLYQTSRLTAVTFIRSEIRRARREQEAYMQTVLNETESDVWPQIALLLDAAMAGLSEADRHAVVLRFFDGKSMKEVGIALGASEDAAKMRLNRAVEKLRRFFTKRGIVLPAAILTAAISANSVQAAPAVLAKTATAVAFVKGATASGSTLTLIKEALKTMAWTKLKFALGLGAAALLVGGAATIVLSGGVTDSEAVKILKSVEAKYASLSNYSDMGKIISGGSQNTITQRFSLKLAREGMYRAEWNDNKCAVWSDGSGDFWIKENGTNLAFVKMWDKGMMTMSGADVTPSISTVAPLFFNETWGNFGKLPIFSSSKVQKRDDEKIGDMECFVLTETSQLPGLTKQETGTNKETLWIGKQDQLIYQIQRVLDWPIVLRPTDDKFVRDLLQKMRSPVNPQTVTEMKKQLEERNRQLAEQQKLNTIARMTFIETHENIAVNQPLSKEDFVHAVPAGLKPLENLKRFP